MALNVQFSMFHNKLIDEDVIIPRLVNQQTMDFNQLCEYLADGSTVTAADVSAVMKQIEMRLPLILGLNSKVICSPEGLTFRPKVSGSLTQSQLKAKLMAKLEADPTLDIDVNRGLTASDLTTSDLTASIAIELPRKWNERFKSKAEFKRVNKNNVEIVEEVDDINTDGDANDNTGGYGSNTDSTTNNQGGSNTDSTNTSDSQGGTGTSTNTDPDNGGNGGGNSDGGDEES